MLRGTEIVYIKFVLKFFKIKKDFLWSLFWSPCLASAWVGFIYLWAAFFSSHLSPRSRAGYAKASQPYFTASFKVCDADLWESHMIKWNSPVTGEDLFEMYRGRPLDRFSVSAWEMNRLETSLGQNSWPKYLRRRLGVFPNPHTESSVIFSWRIYGQNLLKIG